MRVEKHPNFYTSMWEIKKAINNGFALFKFNPGGHPWLLPIFEATGFETDIWMSVKELLDEKYPELGV